MAPSMELIAKIRWWLTLSMVALLLMIRVQQNFSQERDRRLACTEHTPIAPQARGARKLDWSRLQQALRRDQLTEHTAMFYHPIKH